MKKRRALVRLVRHSTIGWANLLLAAVRSDSAALKFVLVALPGGEGQEGQGGEERIDADVQGGGGERRGTGNGATLGREDGRVAERR